MSDEENLNENYIYDGDIPNEDDKVSRFLAEHRRKQAQLKRQVRK